MNKQGVGGGGRNREGKGKGSLGPGVRALDGRENRRVPKGRITNRGVPSGEKRVARGGLESTPSLANSGCTRACSQSVASLSTEASLCPTTTLLIGERSTGTPGAIHFHGSGLGVGGKRLKGRRGGQNWWTRNEGGTRRLRRGVGARESGSRLILFYGDGSGKVSREKGGKRTSGRKLKTDRLFQFSGEEKDEGVVRPSGNECGGDVLESNG